MYLVKLLPVLLVLVRPTNADWFDDFVNGLHDKIVAGADYIKEKAAPAVRETFDEAKNKLKDPETHRRLREWVKEVGKNKLVNKKLKYLGFPLKLHEPAILA
ncbi:unnamed protein product [Gongylonema pulchrum]|uniref:ApoC-IB n=1 Tax=Gongylonema pulchrum TaxID=637853 RepID=A0A183F1D9_9BILA|nr:unnamed protein product [Gongylonema pulchrum]